MAKLNKIITILAISVLCALETFAQKKECMGEASVSAPEKSETENIFYYTIEIPVEDGNIADFEPDFGQLIIKKGISKGTKISSVTISSAATNGASKITATKSTIYKWGLSANNAGIYTIPSFEIYNKEGSQYYTVSETIINITPNNQKHLPTSNAQPIPQESDLFLQWQVDQTNIKAGECVKCKLVLFAKKNISRFFNFNVTKSNNTYITDRTNENVTIKDTLVNDKKYHYGELGIYEITPLATGKAELPQITLELETGAGAPIFEPYENRTVNTLPFTINVDNSAYLQNFPNIDIENNGTIICYDVSGSMEMRDGTPTRYDLEKTINKQLMRQVQGDIKYMAFAGGNEYDLCNDISSYLSDFSKPTEDGTSIMDAILYSIATTKKCKDIVVVTDGTDNKSHVSLETGLDILASYAIRPHIVYINSLNDSVYYEIKASSFSNDTIIKVENTKMSDTEINSLRHQLQALGGDLYLVKTENDIKGVTQRLTNALKTTPKREGRTPKNGHSPAHNFILNKIKEDF